ncbi:MAG TPA: hypothetical protein VIM14_09150 [Polyangia bacterium]
MKEWIAFLLPLATACVGMRLNRLVLGGDSEVRFGLGLRFALGLGTGMLVFSQLVLLTALAGINASAWLAWGALFSAVVDIGLRLRKSAMEWQAPKLQRAHLWLLLLLPVVYSWWVFGQLSTLEGTLEFDANAFWVFKAKLLFLVQGRSLWEVLHESSLAYAHLDYPMLVPCLYTLGYGAVGRVDEFVNKVWPFWMVVALGLGILSLGRFWRRPRPLPIVMLLSFCFLPATLQFIRNEGGTIPMVFFVSLAALLLLRAISARDEICLAAGTFALVGCAMTKFEGMVYAALWLCLLVPLGWKYGWLKRGSCKRSLFWKSALVAALCLLPYGWYRVGRPVPHPESGWWLSGLATPTLTLHRFPQAWFLNVFGRFFDTDFFRWQSLDGDHMQWVGRWTGVSSLVNDQLGVLPWLLLALLALALWQGRARLALACLSIVMLGVFTMLSVVIACLQRMQGDVLKVIDFSAANQVGRYCYPFFVAWFLAATAAWFSDSDDPETQPGPQGSRPFSSRHFEPKHSRRRQPHRR